MSSDDDASDVDRCGESSHRRRNSIKRRVDNSPEIQFKRDNGILAASARK